MKSKVAGVKHYAHKVISKYSDGGYTSNDPQSGSDATDEGFFGNTESNAIASAQYKRGMGINPSAQTESNAEASRSARSMDNPTSRPAPKLNAERRITMDDMAASRANPVPKPRLRPSDDDDDSASNTTPAPKPRLRPSDTSTPSRGGGLGVTTGTTTGSSASRSGTGGLTKQSAYQAMMKRAQDKNGP